MSRLEKLAVHGGTLAAGLSGIAFAVFKYLMENSDPFSAYNHPLQPWALKLHVFSAPLLVFGVGMIFKDHVIAKLRNGAPRIVKRIGFLAMALFVPMVASGYLLQLLSEPAWIYWTAWTHVATGGLFLLAYVAHLVSVAGRIAARNAAHKRAGGGEAPVGLGLARQALRSPRRS